MAVVFLVGITWLLTSSVLGRDGGSFLRNFFSGKVPFGIAFCMYVFFFVHKCNAFIVWSFVGGGEEPTPGMLIESFSFEISDSELIK